jgi:hypothetical protein
MSVGRAPLRRAQGRLSPACLKLIECGIFLSVTDKIVAVDFPVLGQVRLAGRSRGRGARATTPFRDFWMDRKGLTLAGGGEII